MKKVVIVEKIKTIREGIRILINRFSTLECEETFDNFTDFKNKINKLEVDILLMDLQCNCSSILSEINTLKLGNPNLVIIVLIMNEENEMIFDALLNGATTYVHKNSPSPKLVRVLEDAAEGKIIINSLIARKTINYIKKNQLQASYEKEEVQLLKKVTDGNNLLAIEQSLKISNDEIKGNFHNIYNKLHTQSIT